MRRSADQREKNAARGLRPLWRSVITRPLAHRGTTSKQFSTYLDPLQISDPLAGDAIMRGQFALAGETVKAERGNPWRAVPPSRGWAEALHGFEWLYDLRAVDNDAVRMAARRMTDSWLQRHARRGGTAWRPAVLGDRVVAWCFHAALLTDGAEDRFRLSLMRSLTAQARFAAAALTDEDRPLDRVRAALAPAYTALCVEGQEAGLSQAVARVAEHLSAALYTDGMVRSGSPSDLFWLCEASLQLRAALSDAGHAQEAERFTIPLQRMIPTLRMLRLGDGELALLHGGRAEEAEEIDRLLAAAHDSTPARKIANDSGLMRLSAGGAVVLFDAGNAPSSAYAHTAHSAPLTIAFSTRRQRILVNCGSAVHLGPEWETPCRASAAHSTLTIDEKSPQRFEGKLSQSARALHGQMRVMDRQTESDPSGSWALAGHDGYSDEYGLVHFRRLFLGADGTDFRGEDTLTFTKNGARQLAKARAARKSPDGPAFTLRFHLHPEVWPNPVDGGIDLTLQSGEVWRFLQSGGEMKLEDSLYLPEASSPLRARQIAVHGVLGDEDGLIRWAFKRIQ